MGVCLPFRLHLMDELCDFFSLYSISSFTVGFFVVLLFLGLDFILICRRLSFYLQQT